MTGSSRDSDEGESAAAPAAPNLKLLAKAKMWKKKKEDEATL